MKEKFIKKESADRNGKCLASNSRCDYDASHWRPYTMMKSGDVLFYYNVITGEHKWDLSSDVSNSSIPSEPVILKDDMDNQCTGECRNVDANSNAINVSPTGLVEVKQESDVDETNNEETLCTEEEILQHSSTEQPDHQFLTEINSTEPSSTLMALRSTIQRRNISYIGTREASLEQEDVDSEEDFSDRSSASSADDCSNFSDELPEISASESEEDDEEERTRGTNQKSKYDLESLSRKRNSSERNNVGFLNGNSLLQSVREDCQGEKEQSTRFFQTRSTLQENNKGGNRVINAQANRVYPRDGHLSWEGHREELQHGSLRQNISTLAHENTREINGITRICETTSVSNGILLRRDAQEARLSVPFRSTNHNGMPKIGGIFSFANTSNQELMKLNFEKSQKSIDSTILSIFQPDSVIRYDASNVWGNTSPTLHSSDVSSEDLNENLEHEGAIEYSQTSPQTINQDENNDNHRTSIAESTFSDNELSPTPECCSSESTEETPIPTREEPASPTNVNYRYHYSIKCLLPMIGSFAEQADTARSACDNRRPTMILSSQYVGVLPASSDKSDLQASVTAANDNDPQNPMTTQTAAIINQEHPETNRADLNKQATSPSSRIESPTISNAHLDHVNALQTTFPSNANDQYFDPRTVNDIPFVLENSYSRHKCCYCDKSFRFQEELQKHVALRHLLFGGVFVCNSCDDSFNSQEEFTKHLLLHDEVNLVKCRHCKTEFVTVEELASHISTHADESKYPKYKKGVDVDATSESPDQDSTEDFDNSEDKPEKRRECSYCDQTFKHYFAVRLHLRTHSEVDNHTCLLCAKSCLDLKSLRKHVIIHLREKRLECNICHKTFRFHSDYLQHQLVHVPGQLFRCERRGCREIFKTWDELRKHEIDLHEEKRYRCTTCRKSFSRPEKLQFHLRLHTGEKPLECTTCGKRFRTRVILRNHEKIHLECKAYKCSVCDKGFKQKCSMLRHFKTHIDRPKEHPCSLCKKRFTQSCSLQRHLRIHSGERFKCPKCSMKFLESWRMRVHIQNKHSED